MSLSTEGNVDREKLPPQRGVDENEADFRRPPRSSETIAAGTTGRTHVGDVRRTMSPPPFGRMTVTREAAGASSMATIHSAGFNGFSDDRRMGRHRPSSVGHPDVLGYSLEFQRADSELVQQVVQLLPLMRFEDRFQALIRPLDEWVDLGAQSRALAGQ